MTDEIVLRFSVRDDGSPVIERVNKKIGETRKETQALAPGIEQARMKMTDFVSTNAGLIAVLTGSALALKKLYDTAKQGAELEYTIAKFDRLAQSVGSTSDALLGELRTATRGTLSDMEAMALATDLLSLGLAKNADEAVRLAAVQSGLGMDMNQLVLTLTNQTTMRFDALGVSVDGFDEKVKELKATGMDTNAAFKEAFLQQAEMQLERVGNAADESIGAFKRLEAQTKNNIDSAKILSAQALAPLVGYLADSTEAINRNKDILRQLNDELYKEYSAHKVLTPEMQKLIEEYENSQAAIDAQTDSLAENGGQAVLTAEQLKEITDVNKTMLSLIGDIQTAEENYQKTSADLVAEKIELEQKRAEEVAKGWATDWEKVKEYDEALAENSAKVQENKDEYAKANAEILSGLAERKFMQDGVLDDAEFEWLVEKRVQWGLYSEESAAAARKVWQEADHITQSIANIPSNKTVTVTMQTLGGYQQGSQGYNNIAYAGRDAGGQGAAGSAYVVSPAASPEVFIPNQGGSFVPNADKNLIDYKKMARAMRDALNMVGG